MLLIEDNVGDARVLDLTFNAPGFKHVQVTLAQRMSEAEKHLASNAVDVIILDLGLPDTQGLDAVRRTRIAAPHVPIVVLTGLDDESMARQALLEGAQDYLIKGQIEPRGLRRAVRYAMDRKGCADALSQSQERFQQVAEHIRDVFFLMDADSSKMQYVNRAYEEIWGRTRQSLIDDPRSWAESIHPEDRARIQAAEVVRASSATFDYRCRIIRPDGDVRWIRARGYPVPDKSGEPHRIAGIVEDTTEELRAANELRESGRRFSDMLSKIEMISVMLDRDAKITYCNDYLLRLTGWQRDDVLGGDWFALFMPPPHEEMKKLHLSLIGDEPAAWRHENEILTRRGGRVLVRWNNSVLRSPSGEVIGTASIGEDVTEKRKLEAQLQQSQKMESVGRLAGGVAHDFNNVLGVISGCGELLRRGVDGDERLQKYADDIVKAADRGAGLTRQLLAFSRKQVLQPKNIDLNGVVGGMERMLQRLIGEDVELVTLFDNELGPVRADQGQMEQVVMNLAVNARDAMVEGGRLTIETRNAALDADYARDHAGIAVGEYVLLSVSDTGHGMAPEVLSHMFEPFFTTKKEGRGTGLGLSTVDGIVRQSGGHIVARSELGHGTTFKVYFPRTAAHAEERAAPSHVRVELPRGSETILLVEDEESLRAIIRECLQDAGYAVLEASQGAEALTICAHHLGAIDLLMTDVVMPGIGGRDLAARLRLLRPAIQTLYMSGYTDDAVLHHGVLAADRAFLQKPFSVEALAHKVRDVLDGTVSRPEPEPIVSLRSS